jgi:hypothetical protein
LTWLAAHLLNGAVQKLAGSTEQTYEKNTNYAPFHAFLPIDRLVPGIEMATGGGPT